MVNDEKMKKFERFTNMSSILELQAAEAARHINLYSKQYEVSFTNRKLRTRKWKESVSKGE